MSKIKHFAVQTFAGKRHIALVTALLLSGAVASGQQWDGNNNTTDSLFRTGKVIIGRNLTLSPITLNAKLQVDGGPIAQVQGGLYGNFNGDGVVSKASKWIGLGQAGTIFSPITTTYGLAINSGPKYAFYNLVDTTRITATRDLIAGFGTNTPGIDSNQRFIFRYFTGVTPPFSTAIVPAINRDIMALHPNGSVGINETNPVATLLVNAINSGARFKSATVLNEQSGADQTFSAIGAQGNSNVALNVFGFRSQIGVGTAKVAVDLQTNRTPQAPLVNTQEAELVWQDLNYAGPILPATTSSPNAANATTFDRFSIFFRSGSTNFSDRTRVMTILANGTMGINTKNVNPVTVATGLISVGGSPVVADINLDIPNGGVRAIGYYRLSDGKLKKSINTITTALTKIKALRGVTYTFTGMDKKMEVPTLGFIAQEAMKVVPELAVTTNDGMMAVDYDGFIPLLVEGMKEQQMIIEMQQKQIDDTKQQLQKLYDALGINPETTTPAAVTQNIVDANPEFPNTRLMQNRPNPSNGNTVIEYTLNDNGTALLTVSDLAGNARKTFNNLQKGSNRVTINGGDLAPGIYTYTLTINGKVAGSRKMVIAK
jgi:Chaperone of endosialidase